MLPVLAGSGALGLYPSQSRVRFSEEVPYYSCGRMYSKPSPLASSSLVEHKALNLGRVVRFPLVPANRT